jgi:hypothetical protein
MVRKTEHHSVAIYREIDVETEETRLYYRSELQAKREQAIRNRFHVRLEKALDKLNTKRAPLKTTQKYLNASVDCAKKNSRVASDYGIEVIADADKNNAIPIKWKREL